MPAAIALFVYNRPSHTRQTLESLKQNNLAEQSDLVIFSDAEKDPNNPSGVQQVRDYIGAIEGFNSVTVIEREKNLGLAKSIVLGVNKLCDEFGSVIVMEDDLVTSPWFLDFMNRALIQYQDNKEVWHISGWNYPIETDDLPETFFWHTMNCWGWATWADRWKHFRKEPQRLIDEWSKEKIDQFNLGGSADFWRQVTDNAAGKMDTWATFWHATIFENEGFCLNPVRSYVNNIGQDGSGGNSGNILRYASSPAQTPVTSFPEKIVENKDIVGKITDFYVANKIGFIARVINKIMRLAGAR